MNKTIFSGKDINKSTKIGNLYNLADINPPDFSIGNNRLNSIHRRISRFNSFPENGYGSVILNIDRRTRLFGDTSNSCAPLTNDIADLVRFNLHGYHGRCVIRNSVPCPTDNFIHFSKDVQPGSPGLLKRRLHDLLCNTLDLDIHL